MAREVDSSAVVQKESDFCARFKLLAFDSACIQSPVTSQT